MASVTDSDTESSSLSTRLFRVLLLGLALLYFGIQLIYIDHQPIVMDEFGGAADVLQLESQIPYIDFRPYKTVLGYYLQLPMLKLVSDPWTALLAVKAQLAFINTLFIFLAGLLLSKNYSAKAILISILFLISMSTWAERSSELRVDTLTAWAGFFALLCLCRNKIFLAGLLTGLSFFISQKAAYYMLAGGFACSINACFDFIEARQKSRSIKGSLFSVLRTSLLPYLLGIALVTLCYFSFFVFISSFDKVFGATFLSHKKIALTKLYDIHSEFWMQTLTRNPLFYALALYSVAQLSLCKKLARHRRTLLSYSIPFLAFAIWHKQPWPYFFVIVIPTIFLLNLDATEQLIAKWTTLQRSKRILICLVFLVFGVTYQFSRGLVILSKSNEYQRETFRTADALLDSGDEYLAGLDFVYNKTHAKKALHRLSGSKVKRIQSFTESELDDVIREVFDKPPKLFISNYRMSRLPKKLKMMFGLNYTHYDRSVFVFSPLALPNPRDLNFPFNGVFKNSSEQEILVNSSTLAPGESLRIEKGQHRLSATKAARLIWQATESGGLTRNKQKVLFPYVYRD